MSELAGTALSNDFCDGYGRKRGSVLFLCLVILTLLMGLILAFTTLVQKGLRQASDFHDRTLLTKYAESGVELALHDLRHEVSGNGGIIGIHNWRKSEHDVGRDGRRGTHDEGEADGIPTPGEPQVRPVPVGSGYLGAGLCVYVEDTAFTGMQRIVATAHNSNAMVVVETFVRRILTQLPEFGPVYVEPDVALDLKSGAFRIDGHDHNLDGAAGPAPAAYGLTTIRGNEDGENLIVFDTQLLPRNYNQIRGKGGTPSYGEVPAFSFDALFDSFKAGKTRELAPGTHSKLELGDLAVGDVEVIYCPGDLHLTGQGHSGGVLVVDGSLQITGQFRFDGIIAVRGDVLVSGSDASFHTFGSLMVGESMTTEDTGLDDGDEDASELTLAGRAGHYYSSEALEAVQASLASEYTKLYYNER